MWGNTDRQVKEVAGSGSFIWVIIHCRPGLGGPRGLCGGSEGLKGDPRKDTVGSRARKPTQKSGDWPLCALCGEDIQVQIGSVAGTVDLNLSKGPDSRLLRPGLTRVSGETARVRRCPPEHCAVN